MRCSITHHRLILTGLIGLLLCGLNTASAQTGGPNQTQNKTVTITIGAPIGTSKLELGVDYTQASFATWGNPQAMARGEAIAHQVAHYQNIHIFGWGSTNPEPSPGIYDWSSLDRLMAIVRATGGIPVITLCCAPDWMKGGNAGTTNWAILTKAPQKEHFNDFTELARQIALRYPDVKHFQVWNEFKGFWNPTKNRWDYEGYTELYNSVYDALKQISPTIKIGGPYTPMATMLHPNARDKSSLTGPYGTVTQRILNAFDYWNQHKHGADFVTIDTVTHAGDGFPTDSFASLQIYQDIDHWIEQRTTLPIWWAEWYSLPNPADSIPENLRRDDQDALMTATLITMAPTAAVALRWGPEERAHPPYTNGDQDGLWTSTQSANGGQALPFAASMRNFERCFPRGQNLLATNVSSPDIMALASSRCVLMVNKTAAAIDITTSGNHTLLPPYGVAYISRP